MTRAQILAAVERPGYNALWDFFGLSYASWVTLPRVLMHEMPDEWQARMAELMQEFDRTFKHVPQFDTQVQLKKDGKFVRAPDWLAYRHPDRDLIETFK